LQGTQGHRLTCRIRRAGTPPGKNYNIMYKELDTLLHSELRLAVMSILITADSADFGFIKEQTGATSGNLSVQLDKLSSAGYIEIEKTFKGKMPRTICRITGKGTEAFSNYVETLKTYLKL
jgi:DNA-binding MarR family transcriptional regulator